MTYNPSPYLAFLEEQRKRLADFVAGHGTIASDIDYLQLELDEELAKIAVSDGHAEFNVNARDLNDLRDLLDAELTAARDTLAQCERAIPAVATLKRGDAKSVREHVEAAIARNAALTAQEAAHLATTSRLAILFAAVESAEKVVREARDASGVPSFGCILNRNVMDPHRNFAGGAMIPQTSKQCQDYLDDIAKQRIAKPTPRSARVGQLQAEIAKLVAKRERQAEIDAIPESFKDAAEPFEGFRQDPVAFAAAHGAKGR